MEDDLICHKGSLLFACLATLVAAAPAQSQAWVDVFDPSQLLTLSLEMDPADWDTIRRDTTNDIEVPAYFYAEGGAEPALLVSVRRKSSRALPSEADPVKVGLKIDINEFVGGQTWRSLRKLTLENGADTDPISEGFAWNLHEMATGAGRYPSGYHPGLAAWVRLFVNGELIGLYVNVEERDSQFLRNRGLPRGTATGVTRSWLYEIDDLGAGSFELEDGDLPHGPTWNELCYAPFTVGNKKTPACPTPSDAVLATRLPELIDMPIMLTQGAVDAFSSNPDALFTHGKNFRHIDFNTALFPGRTRLYLMWDLDAAITGVDTNIYAEQAQKGYKQTDYQSVILNHPVFRAQYNAIMAGLLDPASGPLSETALHSFLDGLEATTAAALAEDPYAGFDAEGAAALFDDLRGWVSQRIANVQDQLQANLPAARP
jgi:spore coat protein CotH